MGRMEQMQKDYDLLQNSVTGTIQETQQKYEKQIDEYRSTIQKMRIADVEKRENGSGDGDLRLQLEMQEQQIQSMKVGEMYSSKA